MKIIGMYVPVGGYALLQIETIRSGSENVK